MNQDLARLCVLQLNNPSTIRIVPLSLSGLCLEFHIFVCIVFNCHAFQICFNLSSWRIVAAPLGIILKGELINMGWNVARDTRIAMYSSINRCHPCSRSTYLFSNHVPPRSAFFSYTTRSKFSIFLGKNIDAIRPDIPAPMTMTFIGRISSIGRLAKSFGFMSKNPGPPAICFLKAYIFATVYQGLSQGLQCEVLVFSQIEMMKDQYLDLCLRNNSSSGDREFKKTTPLAENGHAIFY